MSICVPAPRHAHLFPDLKVPRTPNFNPETNERPSWMGKLARLSSERERVMDAWHRARVRCMQSIDEMVETLVETLEKMGELENTYLFFTSDNGFHLGQHRLGAGKMTGIEEDVRVPLIVRGPGVKKGVKNYGFNSHTDLAPTLLKIAGAPLADYFDGRPIDLHDHPEAGGGSETLAVEFWSTNFVGTTLPCSAFFR